MRNYRGLTKDGKWVYGWYVERRDSHYNTYSVINSGDDDIEDEVIPETVGQFTGLKDKNDKEAYQDDKISAYGYSNWVIDWHNNGWKLKQDCIDHWTEIPKDFVIIGNIRENPELQEKTK